MPVSSAGQSVPANASVVIIGGGVIGTSIAFHLAEAGVTGVVLLERAALGSGSTCKAAGGVRAQFSDELNIELGARSLEAFTRFRHRPGQEIDDGHCTPESVVLGYATAARRLGATLLTRISVIGLETEGDQVRTVVTDHGPIRAGTVICAAGAWSRAVGEMAGTVLPVTPLRRQVIFTEPMPRLPAVVPFTIDFASTFYFHREGQGLLMGMSDPQQAPGFHLDYSDDWLPRLGAAIERCAPQLLTVGLTNGWAGLYEDTPDHNALIGRANAPSNFLYATGFSGHGFLQAPAVGEVIRDLYLDRAPVIDVRPLSAERFAGDPHARPETHLV